MLPWFWLFVAIIFEVAGTFCLKLSHGLERLFPSIATFIFYFVCFFALALSLKKIEISTAYAIWAGLGTALIAFIGIYHFNETVTPIKIISLALIIAGVVGLNLSSTAH